MSNSSIHTIRAVEVLRNNGEIFLSNIFATRPFNRSTVIATLEAQNKTMLALHIEILLDLHNTPEELVDM